jgi:hypothetical protein
MYEHVPGGGAIPIFAGSVSLLGHFFFLGEQAARVTAGGCTLGLRVYLVG